MSNKARLLDIAVFHNLPSGGALRAMYEKIRLFEDKGHRVSLYTFSTSEKEFLRSPKLSGTFFEAALSFTGPLKFIHYFLATKLCAQRINGSDADLVYVDKCRFFGSPPILRFLNKKTVLYLHEPLGVREYSIMAQNGSAARGALLLRDFFKLSFCAMLNKALSIPERVWIKWQDRRNTLAAGRVLTCSRFAKEWIKRVYGIEAIVSYQGVNATFFRPATKIIKKNQVLSVGRIESRKGHDFLISALSIVPNEKRPRLIVVCDEATETSKAELEKTARCLDVGLDIVYRPTQDRLRQLYQESQLVLCAGILEPFGLVPLEALACKTPVIAVDEGGYRETVQDGITGFLLPRDTKVWAEQLEYLFDKPEVLMRLGAAGRSLVESQWTWQGFLDTIENVV